MIWLLPLLNINHMWLCLHIHYIDMCTCMCVGMFSHVWRPGVYISFFPSPSILFCEIRYLTEPQVRHQLDGQRAPRSHLFLAPNTGFINTCCHTPFLPSAGDQNLGPHACVASVIPHWMISSVLIHVCWPVILLYKIWNIGFSFSFLTFHRDLCSRTYRSPKSIFTVSVFAGKKYI